MKVRHGVFAGAIVAGLAFLSLTGISQAARVPHTETRFKIIEEPIVTVGDTACLLTVIPVDIPGGERRYHIANGPMGTLQNARFESCRDQKQSTIIEASDTR